MSEGFIIAIDGPVASGKGTIAMALAKKLPGFYLTTGLFYRSITLYCLDHNIDIYSEEAVTKALPSIHISVEEEKFYINQQEVTNRLHERIVDQSVAVVSNYAAVRAYLLPQQRSIGSQQLQLGKIVILEGRDIATRVFPDADVKLFLTSDVQTRANRRFMQMRERGEHVSFDEVLQDTKDRDQKDMFGPLAYLVHDPENYGYALVDDTNLTEEQTLERILALIAEKTEKKV